MAQFFEIHPVQPQARLIHQAAEILRASGLIAVPTDCAYSLVGLTGTPACSTASAASAGSATSTISR